MPTFLAESSPHANIQHVFAFAEIASSMLNIPKWELTHFIFSNKEPVRQKHVLLEFLLLNPSMSVFNAALYYLSATHQHPDLEYLLKNNDTKKVYLTATINLASKMLEDHMPSNKMIANYCGVDARELNAAERKILSALDWDAKIPEEEYERLEILIKTGAANLRRFMPELFPALEEKPNIIIP